jgi:hypothetical protein
MSAAEPTAACDEMSATEENKHLHVTLLVKTSPTRIDAGFIRAEEARRKHHEQWQGIGSDGEQQTGIDRVAATRAFVIALRVRDAAGNNSPRKERDGINRPEKKQNQPRSPGLGAKCLGRNGMVCSRNSASDNVHSSHCILPLTHLSRPTAHLEIVAGLLISLFVRASCRWSTTHWPSSAAQPSCHPDRPVCPSSCRVVSGSNHTRT